MSTSDESESLPPPLPTAKTLLALLQKIEQTNPEKLNQPVGTWEDEYAGYTAWQGVLEEDEDMLCLSYKQTPEMDAWSRRMYERRQAEEARAAEERKARQIETVPEELRRFLP